MTMDEIRTMFDDLDGAYYAEHRAPYRAYRAALLQAVEGVVRERDEARGALKAAEWQSYSGHKWNRLLNERDAFRVRAEAAEKERDEAEQKLAQSEDRVIAIGTDLARSESALAAMREALEDIATLSDARRRLVTAEAHEKALEMISRRTRSVLASPPTAALRTETGGLNR